MRALRRFHKRRMKKRAKEVYHFKDKAVAIKWADHLQLCSCMGCGNPRKWFKELTIQERRHNQKVDGI